jgi:Fur family zinc uptake transcriptional regulator
MPNSRRAPETLNAKEEIVLAALRAATRPRTAYELIEQLRHEGITAPPTVYRALNRLIALGHIHRLESLNAYIACRHGHCATQGSTAFAICDDCGQVEEIGEPKVTGSARTWANKNDFSLKSVTFELRGQCRSCRENAQTR